MEEDIQQLSCFVGHPVLDLTLFVNQYYYMIDLVFSYAVYNIWNIHHKKSANFFSSQNQKENKKKCAKYSFYLILKFHKNPTNGNRENTPNRIRKIRYLVLVYLTSKTLNK